MLLKIRFFYFLLIEGIKSANKNTQKHHSNEKKICPDYIMIGFESIEDDEIKHGNKFPPEILITEIKKSVKHHLLTYNKQECDLNQIYDIFEMKNDQFVTLTKKLANLFKISEKPYINIKKFELLDSYEKALNYKPRPLKIFYLFLVYRLVDFFDYFDTMLTNEKINALSIFTKNYYHHEIYDDIETNEISVFIERFIKNQLVKNNTVDTYSLYCTVSEYGKKFNYEKFKNLFNSFVEEFFIYAYIEFANIFFRYIDDLVSNKRLFCDACYMHGKLPDRYKDIINLIEITNPENYKNLKNGAISIYFEYEQKMFRNFNYFQILSLIYKCHQFDIDKHRCKFYVIDINYYNQLMIYFNYFLLECEHIENNAIPKKLDEVMNLFLHVFFGNISFIFNLKDTDFQMFNESEHSKRNKKIMINLGCEFRLSSISYINYMLKILTNPSVTLKNLGKEIISNLLTLYHDFTLHAFIYFFKVKRSQVFQLNFFGQCAYETNASKLQHDSPNTFAIDEAVDLEYLQDLANKIVTLLVNLNITCFEELSKKFSGNQKTIIGMNTIDTKAKIKETLQCVKSKYNI